MKRRILKSDSAFVLIGDSPSWKTTQETGRFFSLVQNASFGVSMEKQKIKQLGQQKYAVNHINRSPNVNLQIDYYLSPYLNNEYLLGFNGRSTAAQNAIDDNFLNKSNNFYLITNQQNSFDAILEARKKSNINFSGYDVVSFGNCYLTNYKLNFSLNNIPTVSTSYSCSNMKIDNLTGNILRIPAINHQSGNANNAGLLNLADSTYPILSGYMDTTGVLDFDISKLPVASHRESSFVLQNLQVGGIKLNSSNAPILQTLNVEINFERNDLYGLGSNYVFDRKLKYPINAQISFDSFVSGFTSGFISGLINNESGYDFSIAFSNPSFAKATGFYQFKNAKLDNFNYSMQVNDIMNFSASFSVEILDYTGFFINRSISQSSFWPSLSQIWNNFNIIWK
jgi:hypothetical protein